MKPFLPQIVFGIEQALRNMFTVSEIVKSFQLNKTKCGYIMNFGLAPYFKDLLLKEVKASDCFGV